MPDKIKEWERYSIDLAKYMVDVLKYRKFLEGNVTNQDDSGENPTPPLPPVPPK
jgi:hypothetical protein